MIKKYKTMSILLFFLLLLPNISYSRITRVITKILSKPTVENNDYKIGNKIHENELIFETHDYICTQIDDAVFKGVYSGRISYYTFWNEKDIVTFSDATDRYPNNKKNFGTQLMMIRNITALEKFSKMKDDYVKSEKNKDEEFYKRLDEHIRDILNHCVFDCEKK